VRKFKTVKVTTAALAAGLETLAIIAYKQPSPSGDRGHPAG